VTVYSAARGIRHHRRMKKEIPAEGKKRSRLMQGRRGKKKQDYSAGGREKRGRKGGIEKGLSNWGGGGHFFKGMGPTEAAKKAFTTQRGKG